MVQLTQTTKLGTRLGTRMGKQPEAHTPRRGILAPAARRARRRVSEGARSHPVPTRDEQPTPPPKPASSGVVPDGGEITLLIDQARAGRSEAHERLLSAVYAELRVIAASYIRHERPNHTLGATALVNESYLKLFGGDATRPEISFEHRHAFFKAASVAMRRILIDHARAKAAVKRSPGTGRRVISADMEIASRDADPHDLLALDEALRIFESEDERAASVVQLRFYAGRQISEIAVMLGLSERTVKRDWEFARARLQQLLDQATSGPAV